MQLGLVPLILALLTPIAAAQAAQPTQSLLEARKGFTTKLTEQSRNSDPMPAPPAEVFELTTYKGPLGEMAAYVSKVEKAAGKSAGIVWITGGFPAGGASEDAWQPVDPANDQSATAFREAGVVLMLPALRGSYGNPGAQESFFGEVDDVLAAVAHLRARPEVDPTRVFLGGHSTGGTLALLAAECGADVRGVLAFGPIDDPAGYGQSVLTFDAANEQERRLRAPLHYLGAIRAPTFCIEGAGGNAVALAKLDLVNSNPLVGVLEIAGAGHFDLLAPLTRLAARKIAALKGPETFALTLEELQAAFDEQQSALREADDLDTLAALRRQGLDLSKTHTVQHALVSRERAALENAQEDVRKAGFTTSPIAERKDRDGRPFFRLEAQRKLKLSDLEAVFGASRALEGPRRRHGFTHYGWSVP